MPVKRTRKLSPNPENEFITPQTGQLLSPTPHGQDDYQQLVKAVEDYLLSHGIHLHDYGGKWGVSHKGKRELFYGAGDAFAYAVGLIIQRPPVEWYGSDEGRAWLARVEDDIKKTARGD